MTAHKTIRALLFWTAIILALCWWNPAGAATYYIGSDPTDDYPSWTAKQADKADETGDVIVFRDDETFREQITVPASGVTYTSHGTGAKPIISGADVVTGAWSQAIGGGADYQYFYDNFDNNSLSKWTGSGNGIVAQNQRCEVTVDGTNTVPKRIENHGAAGFRSCTEIWATWNIIPHAITSSNTQYIQGGGLYMDSTNKKTPVIGFRQTSGVKYFYVTYNDDTAQYTADIGSALVMDQIYRITVYFKRATAVGANNGILRIWIDSTLAFEVTNADTDTMYADDFLLGNNYRSGMNAVYYIDNIKISNIGSVPIAAASSNVYSLAMATEPNQAWFNGNLGNKVYSTYKMRGRNMWMWQSGILYAYAPSDPATYFNSIEASQRNYCINTNDADSLNISGVKLVKANSHGIYENATGSSTFSAVESTENYGDGWYRTGASTGNTYAMLKIHDNISNGMELAGTANQHDSTGLNYSLIYRNGGDGVKVAADQATCMASNNDVYNNDLNGWNFSAQNTGFTLKNNISYGNLLYQLTAPAASTLTHANNAYFGNNPNPVSYNGTAYTAATLTNFEATAISANPLQLETALPYPVAASAIGPDGTIYAGFYISGTGGVLKKSTDGGANWTDMVTFSDGTFRSVYVAANGYLYCSPFGEALSDASRGLWRCADPTGHPTTWTRVIDLSADAVDQTNIWGMSETAAGVLFAGVYSLGTGHKAIIYRSTDNGGSWSACYSDTAVDQHIHDVVADNYNGAVYASIDGSQAGGTPKIIKSVDNGDSWNQILSTLDTVISIAVTPTARIFCSDAGSNALYRTTDDLAVETVFYQPVYQGYPWAKVDPATGYVYVGTWNSDTTGMIAPILYSTDEGLSWSIYRTTASAVPFSGSQTASNIVNRNLIIGIAYTPARNGLLINLDKQNDFTLQTSSPCIDAGTPVGLTTDYLGNSLKGYHGLPDIGSYEYQNPLGVWGDTYYVSKTGAGAKDGTSEANAFENIAGLQTAQTGFAPGDVIKIIDHLTGMWTLNFATAASGAAGNPIIVEPLSPTGLIEIDVHSSFLGSSGDWTDAGGNIWTRTMTSGVHTGSSGPKRIWFDGVEKYVNHNATVTADYPWYWASNVLRVYSVGNPATTFSSISAVVGPLNSSLYIVGDGGYWTFRRMKFHGGNFQGANLMNGAHHITFEDCWAGSKTFKGWTIDGDTSAVHDIEWIGGGADSESNDTRAYDATYAGRQPSDGWSANTKQAYNITTRGRSWTDPFLLRGWAHCPWIIHAADGDTDGIHHVTGEYIKIEKGGTSRGYGVNASGVAANSAGDEGTNQARYINLDKIWMVGTQGCEWQPGYGSSLINFFIDGTQTDDVEDAARGIMTGMTDYEPMQYATIANGTIRNTADGGLSLTNRANNNVIANLIVSESGLDPLVPVYTKLMNKYPIYVDETCYDNEFKNNLAYDSDMARPFVVYGKVRTAAEFNAVTGSTGTRVMNGSFDLWNAADILYMWGITKPLAVAVAEDTAITADGTGSSVRFDFLTTAPNLLDNVNQVASNSGLLPTSGGVYTVTYKQRGTTTGIRSYWRMICVAGGTTYYHKNSNEAGSRWVTANSGNYANLSAANTWETVSFELDPLPANTTAFTFQIFVGNNSGNYGSTQSIWFDDAALLPAAAPEADTISANIQGDPKLIGITGKPAINSPARDTAVAVDGRTTDAGGGSMRGTAWDIGAYEAVYPAGGLGLGLGLGLN